MFNHNHVQPFRFYQPKESVKSEKNTVINMRAQTPQPHNKVTGHKYGSWGTGY